MAFVAAKCTECGASIEVDDSKDAGICRNCGTAFVTQKAIHNYNTFVTQNIVLDENLKSELFSNSNFMSLKAAEEQCKKLYEIKDLSALFDFASKMTKKWPTFYLGYLYAAKSYQIYTAYNTPEYPLAIKNEANKYSVLVTASMVEHDIQELFQKTVARMTYEERSQHQDFIAAVKQIIIDFSNELKIISNKKPKIWIWLSTAAFLFMILLTIISSVPNAIETGITGLILISLFITVPVAVVFILLLISSKKRHNRYKYLIETNIESINKL